MSIEIENILTKKTLSKADLAVLENYEPKDKQNLLYSFFTPVWLCEVMYKLAIRYGFNTNGQILEPACGTGNFLTVVDKPQNVTAFELDTLNYKIAKKRVPKATIYNQYFETAFLQPPRYTNKLKNDITWLENAPFDLVIGNPPYGKYLGRYAPYFKSLKFKQVEQFFMYQSLQLLKKGRLLVFITASSFLRNKDTYLKAKERIGGIAEFVDAYRMPKVFKHTEVPTDIIILRRK
ncbi:Eco57I restriction-modification methylase [Kordia periserrulae]|uniref:site-specific DNA-methyltransferase (adenine-specific) n=1 Tax=Kordia periserrulae TaxID=701523 RepID=A0A2T6BVX4_9FLAO|nr:Eco57I restriction-modification methylase domain-containing protein [Kordia periserrulae]PTX60234.1 Eco57I restriction-modification methylase [Kordia periserrulae]